MGVLRRFLPMVLVLGLFLFVAIFPLVEQEAGTLSDPLTPEERAFIVAHGPIRYAPDPQFPPFEFLDSSGVAKGITPDLLAIMGKRLGVEFRTVAYPTWSDVLEAVKQGKVDLLGTLTRTPEREGFLLFSKPYLSVPYVLFVRHDGGDSKTIEDMVSRRLGVVKNYGINTWLSVIHPNIHPVAVEDTATGLTMVATGELDALLETLPVGALIVREKSLTNIRIVPRHIYDLPQHFGVRKEKPLLLSIVQKGLDSLSEKDLSEVFVRWTGHDFSHPPPAISPFLRNAILILVAGAILSLIWIVALRRSIRQATQSFRESEARYRKLFEHMQEGFAYCKMIFDNDDPIDFIYLSVNETFETLTALKNVVGKRVSEVISGIRQSDPALFEIYGRVARTGKPEKIEIFVEALQQWFLISIYSPENEYFVVVFDVITDRKRAEAEKEKLQAQLLQAMKMEAVGRLAGGVAHDFNNLLTVITGYSELLLQKVGKESPMHGEVEEIKRAGERAASLTQQLLAFSRKQIIEPKVVHLDHLVAEMHKMLARLIGENIALQATTGKSLGSVKVDPGQFQQILMNLVVNARDAMPDGGKIVIETANVDLDEGYCALHPYVKPGRFVMLAVSDTGTRDERRGQGAHLRAVLHHEGAGERNGPGPCDDLRRGASGGRLHRGVLGGRDRDDLQDLPAACRGGGGETGERRPPGGPSGRDGDGADRGGRGHTAEPVRPDPGAAGVQGAAGPEWGRGDRGGAGVRRSDRPAADGRGDAGDERKRAGDAAGPAPPGDEGAVHVRLHGRRDLPPWGAGRGRVLHREAVHPVGAREEGPGSARRDVMLLLRKVREVLDR